MIAIKAFISKFKMWIISIIGLLSYLWFKLNYKDREQKTEGAKAVKSATDLDIKRASSIIAVAFGTHPDDKSWTEDEEVAYVYINKYLDYKMDISIEYEKLTGRMYFPDVIKYLKNSQVNKLTQLNYF